MKTLRILINICLFLVTIGCGTTNKPKDEEHLPPENPTYGSMGKYIDTKLSSHREDFNPYRDHQNSYWIKAYEANGTLIQGATKIDLHSGLHADRELIIGLVGTIPLFADIDLTRKGIHQVPVFIRTGEEKIEVGEIRFGYINNGRTVNALDPRTLSLCEEDYQTKCQLDIFVSSDKNFRRDVPDDYEWIKHTHVRVDLTLSDTNGVFTAVMGEMTNPNIAEHNKN